MKKVLTILGYVLTAGALMFGIGLMRAPQHTLRVASTIRVSPEDLWTTFTNGDRWAEWVPGIDTARPRSSHDGNPVWRIDGDWGNADVEIVAVREPYDIDAIIRGERFSGKWTIRTDPVPVGSQLVITEHGEIENPFFRGLAFFGDSTTEMVELIEALGKLYSVRVDPKELAVAPESE